MSWDNNNQEKAPHPVRAEQIFMTAMCQQAWQAGRFEEGANLEVDLLATLKAARAAWRAVHTQDRVRSVADTLLAIQATKTLEELKAVGEQVKKLPLTASERDSMTKAFLGQRDRISLQKAEQIRSGDTMTDQIADTFNGTVEQ